MQNYYVFMQSLYALGAKCVNEQQLEVVASAVRTFTHEELVNGEQYTELTHLAKTLNFNDATFHNLLERYAQ